MACDDRRTAVGEPGAESRGWGGRIGLKTFVFFFENLLICVFEGVSGCRGITKAGEQKKSQDWYPFDTKRTRSCSEVWTRPGWGSRAGHFGRLSS